MKLGERTQQKLDEARYFCGELASRYGELRKFDFYLSAFISSARSVTWVMRSEFQGARGWEEWYADWDARRDQRMRALLKGTAKVRNRSQKQEHVQTMSTLTVQGMQFPAKDYDRVRVLMERAAKESVPVKISGPLASCVLEMDFGNERLSFEGVEIFAERELPEFPGENVVEVCARYLEELTQLVAECRTRFAF